MRDELLDSMMKTDLVIVIGTGVSLQCKGVFALEPRSMGDPREKRMGSLSLTLEPSVKNKDLIIIR